MERIAGQVMGPPFFRAHRGKQRELLTLCCALFVQLHRLDWRSFVDDVARYETQGPYVFVDRSLRREHDALTQFSLLDFLPLMEWFRRRGRWGTPTRQGKSLTTAVRPKVERSQSLYVDGGGTTC